MPTVGAGSIELRGMVGAGYNQRHTLSQIDLR
jgi:hypothetical protein